MTGVYKITSPSGRVYIGQSWRISRRWYNHGKSTHTPILFSSIKKYGKEKHLFQIIHELPKDVSQQTMDAYECFYIDQYKDCGFKLMNIKGGGSRGKISEETAEKIRQKHLGRKITWAHKIGRKGRTHTQDIKDIISRTHKGRKLSESHRRKVINNLSRKGAVLSNDTKTLLSEISKEWWKKNRENGNNGIRAAFSNEDVINIRKRIMNGETQLSHIAKEYNVSLTTISFLVKMKTYKHIILDGYEPFSRINFVKIGGDKYKFKKKKDGNI